jgi:hypothetical protein
MRPAWIWSDTGFVADEGKKKKARSFLKKRTKKLLVFGVCAAAPRTPS